MPRPRLAWPVRKAGPLAVVVLSVLLGVVWMCPRISDPVTSPQALVPPQNDQVVKSSVANPGYLGQQACAECHAKRVAEFQETRHFLANRVPSADIMPAGFEPGRGVYRVPELSLRFEMTESDRRFRQTAFPETGTPISAHSRPSAPKSVTSDIAFIYGAAGGNDEVYFTWHDDRLYELPIVWLAPQNRWGASPFDRHGNGDFSRDMTIRCLECHNTWFEHVPGSRNQYGHDNAIIGVTCEVCHGPGRDHVDFHRQHPQVKEAHDVIRPAHLSRERQMDLCAQCHSNALKHRGPAFNYRPGEPLDDFYVTLRTKHPEQDHVANQTTYLRQSRCFQQSDNLTCVTCHNPHRSRSTTNAGAASCRKCHATDDCTDRKAIPAAVQDDCIGCHMPEHRKIQVFFQTEGDKYIAPVKRYEHRIGIYPLARQSVLREWYRTQPDSESRDEAARLSKLLAQSWASESEKRQHDHRYLAAIDACRESLTFAPDAAVQEKLQELIQIQNGIDADYQDALWHEQERRYPQAIEAFKRVLAAKPDFAMAHGKLGTNYAVVGEKQLALKHLQTVAEYDPDEPYAPAMLGWLAYLEGRPEEALEYYRKADEVEPYTAQINHQMGLAFTKLERWTDAIERFTKAVTIDPKAANACLGLSQALLHVAKPDDALKYGLQAARLTNFEEPEALLNLAEAYAEAGKLPDAIRTAEQALAITRQPQLAIQIRTRLESFRNR